MHLDTSFLVDLLREQRRGRFGPACGRLLANLRATGMPIATMDLLVATAALLNEAPLVTRNVRHFARVPGLRVIGY